MKRAWLILAALVAGLLLGAYTGDSVPFLTQSADLIGTWWLNGLRMTVIPLVVALLVTGRLLEAPAMTGTAMQAVNGRTISIARSDMQNIYSL